MKSKFTIVILLLFAIKSTVLAQNINWISFEQLDDSLKVKQKKTFIFFYADWCDYCKKMEQTTFKTKEVISAVNSNFYAVKMNAEEKGTILFDGVAYKNTNIGKYRNPKHEIPLLLASRKDLPFSLPATILLDENFKIKKRFFEYLSPKDMLIILKD